LDWYLITKTIHIISSTILFGCGLGIAFFMFRSAFTDNVFEKFYAVRTTVLADYCFTTPAVIVQPLSGFALIHMAGYEWTDLWLMWTYGLYILAGLCWIPVVFIQLRLKNILAACAASGEELPPLYHRLFKIWFALGWPAFIALVVVFYLMVAKPL
jgi:uncharacterized membrane protein